MRILFLLGVAAPALLAAAPSAPPGETLAGAIAEAYRSNPTLQSGRYDLRSADESVVQARAELRPSASLQATAGLDRSVEGDAARANNFLSPPSSTQNSQQVGVSITQPLYTGGKATADRASAQALVAAQREVLRGTEGDLLLGVVTAYLDVRRYTAALAVWNDSVNELQALTREIEARRQAGELTLTDVAQAQGQLALAREEVVQTQQALEAARTDFSALVGHDPGTLAPPPPLPQLPADADAAYADAMRNSPELAQARDAERSSREDIVAARAAGMPTLSLRGSASVNGAVSPYRLRDQNQDYSGSLVLTVPLVQGGAVASQIRQAEDRNGSDRFKIEIARRQLVRSVSYAWNQMVAADRSSELDDQRRGFAETQLDGMINEYRVGLRSTFDVLFAQQTLRDAEVSLLGTSRDRYVAQATLLRRIGLLQADMVMTGVAADDPVAHLRSIARRGALPWDGLVASLDGIGVAHPGRRPLDRPPASPAPAFASPADAPAKPAFSRSLPATPIPGTAGRTPIGKIRP